MKIGEIEAVRQEADKVITGAGNGTYDEALDALVGCVATLDHLTNRLSEVERERDEARALLKTTLDDYADLTNAARVTNSELAAAQARVVELDTTISDLLYGTKVVEYDLRTHLATLRAAIAEAVRRADGMSWPDKFGALEAVEPLRNLTKPDTPSERIMSDKDRGNPVEGAHPTQPEAEDALVERDAQAMAQSFDNAHAQLAADAIRSAFFVSVSGDEKPYRYHLRLAYPTMEAMHEAEDRLKQFAALDRFKPLADRLASRGLTVRGEGVER